MAAKKKTKQKTNTRKKTARKSAGRAASTSSSKRDEYTAVLEDLRSQFEAFGESLTLTREVLTDRMERIEERMQKMEDRMQKVEMRMQKMEDRMQKSEERIFYLERANLELLKEIRENTISRSEFEELREKVRKLEAKQS